MSIKTRIAAVALATLAVTGTIASTTQAQAKPLHGVLEPASSAPRSSAPRSPPGHGYYYDGYRRCGFVRQYDVYGNYIGRVRTCTY